MLRKRRDFPFDNVEIQKFVFYIQNNKIANVYANAIYIFTIHIGTCFETAYKSVGSIAIVLINPQFHPFLHLFARRFYTRVLHLVAFTFNSILCLVHLHICTVYSTSVSFYIPIFNLNTKKKTI